jgi:hypothetical protein
MDCFKLHERRSGEICNACVLLVKRWKKLPAGSERNWRHVSVILVITLNSNSILASASSLFFILNRMLVVDYILESELALRLIFFTSQMFMTLWARI